ncbi:hypothetical protein [Mangrovimonas cancribranchiae]|uniref:Uncharacterized protein n=1 Tax=Mangrovimonas cancribranchiae TaxID=3080055 RepID=A0AAU6NYC2_9FLAO
MTPTKNYHNTNGITGEALETEEQQATTQQQRVLVIFKKNNNKPMSASQVYVDYIKEYEANLLKPFPTPLHSIRRAITNLKNEDKLRKTTETILGFYKKPEYLYKPI